MEKVKSIKKDISRIILDMSSESGTFFFNKYEGLISKNDLLLYSFFLRVTQIKEVEFIPNNKLIQTKIEDKKIVIEISKNVIGNISLVLFSQILIQEVHIIMSSKLYSGHELDIVKLKINSKLHYVAQHEFSLTSFGVNSQQIKLPTICKIFKPNSLIQQKEIALLNFNKDIYLSSFGQSVYGETYNEEETQLVKKNLSFGLEIEKTFDFSKKHFLKDIDFSYEKVQYIRELISEQKKSNSAGSFSNTNFDSISKNEEATSDIEEKIGTAKKLAETTGSSSAGEFSSDLEELIKPDDSGFDGLRQIVRLLRGEFPNLKEFKRTYSRTNKKYKLYQGRRKKKNLGSIYVLLDTSGSVSDKMLSSFFAILLKFLKLGIEVIVYECDAETKNSYKLKRKDQFQVKGRGGTSYNETLQEIYSQNPSLVFIMGDGLPFDKPEEKSNTIWILPKGCDYKYTNNRKIYLD